MPLMKLSLTRAVLFYFSDRSLNEQEQDLIRALRQSAVQCYAVEGFYPESPEYLEESYGIQYDHDRFLSTISRPVGILCRKSQ